MRNKLIIIFSWICVLLTMTMIYAFSAENAEESTETSTGVIENVLNLIMPEEEITHEVVKKYQFPFRKAAHFGIYMLLGFSLANALRNTFSKKSILSYLIAFPIGVIYSVSDEWHQSFSAGRGPSYKDVLIDSSGVLIGIVIFAVFICVFLHFKNKKSPIKQ